MAGLGFQQGVSIQLDSRDWYRLSQDLKKFDPALLTALRRRLRNVGRFAVDDIKRTLGLPSPGQGEDTGAFRQMLADATKVSVSFSQRQAGVKVSTNNRSIPAEHQPVMRVYNKNYFRHPVFGDDNVWVAQRGRPYFGQAFTDMVLERARKEVFDALADATAALGRTP